MSDDNLPDGWARAPIRRVCSLVNGRVFRPVDWTPEGVPIVRIQNLNDPGASFNRYSGPVDPKFLIDAGELLFAWSGTPGTSFGAHIWRGQTAVLNQHIFRVRFDGNTLNKDFLRLSINERLDQLIHEAHGGAGLAHVTKSVFEATEILVAPYPEQRRIVEAVDALLAKVNAVRQSLSAVPLILKRFRQSVLAAACSGRLTQVADDEWSEKRLGDICRDITVGHVGPMIEEYVGNGIPFLRSQNVREFRIDSTNLRYISREFHVRLRKSSLSPGDVVVVRSGNAGVAAVIPAHLAEANCADLVILRPGPDVDPNYLAIHLNSNAGRAHVEDVKVGIAQGHFNIGSARRMPIRVPALAAQRETVQRVETLFAAAAAAEHRVRSATRRAESLTAAVLAKAFRGELVRTEAELASAEGRAYESAEALLARVHPNGQ
jgi:type I restriction enzyme S subunit